MLPAAVHPGESKYSSYDHAVVPCGLVYVTAVLTVVLNVCAVVLMVLGDHHK